MKRLGMFVTVISVDITKNVNYQTLKRSLDFARTEKRAFCDEMFDLISVTKCLT